MIVWLASFPRSGNTFVRMVLDRVYGAPSSSVYDEGGPLEHGKGPEMALWVNPAPPTPLPEGLDSPGSVQFVKTHAPPTDDAPAICIVRDGRDVLVSYAHFLRSFNPAMARRPFAEVLRELITARDLYRSWSLNVNAWRCRGGSAPTAWVRYETLAADPVTVVAGCLRELGLDLRPAGGTMPDFAELQRGWPAFFRKGKSGAWREDMPEELHQLFWKHHGAMMDEFGYRDNRPASFDDRAARMALIETLDFALRESEADRAARLQSMHRLEADLKASRADQAARQEVIRRLEAALRDPAPIRLLKQAKRKLFGKKSA